MAHSFHPHPVVGATKIFLMSVFLSIFIFLVRELLERIMVPLLIAIWAVGLIFIAVAFIAARFQTLTLEENSMLYQSGIISTRRILLPYAKITETSFTQGLVQRLFGVGTLHVDTAGGSTIAIRMNDVRHEELQRILKEIKAKGGPGDGT